MAAFAAPPALTSIGRGAAIVFSPDLSIESLSVVNTARLSSSTLRALGLPDGDSMTFVVSDIFEELFQRFVGHLDRLATSEQLAPDASLVALLEQR